MDKKSDKKLIRLYSSKSETNLLKNVLPSQINKTTSAKSVRNSKEHNRLKRLDGIDLDSKELDMFESNGIESVNIKKDTFSIKNFLSVDNLSQTSVQSKDTAISTKSNGLSPISASEARTKNYIVGSVNHQLSMLGPQELTRLFPSHLATVSVITWNMCGKQSAGQQLASLLLPDKMLFVPDIYAIGVQEGAFSSTNSPELRSWETQLQSTIGPSHVLLHSSSLGVLHVSIFVRRDLVWYTSLPEHAAVGSKSSAANLYKTKGAVAISFQLFGSSFLFVNCHLPAHERKNPQRIAEYKRICTQLGLPRNLRPLPAKYRSVDVTERFDYVFWFGDLNFRVERQQNDTIKLLTQLTLMSNPNMRGLLLSDQLMQAIEKGEIFSGFKEADMIRFLPTYKYIPGTNNFDDVSNRVPSWTDRILYRSKASSGSARCLEYDSVQKLSSSDHKPVYAIFELQLRGGKDTDIPLNAGLFNREVYVQGIRRRREVWNEVFNQKNINSRDSHICSVC